MGDPHPQLRHPPPHPLGHVLDGLDAVVEIERLAAAGRLAPQRRGNQLLVELADMGLDRVPVAGRRRDDADVAQAREAHVQRARDRGRRHREHVHLEPQLAQELLLGDAEALLLVEHDEAELLRHDVAGEHAVGADQDVDLARPEVGQHLLHLGRGPEPRHHLDPDREVAEAVAQGGGVLLGEDGRRHQHQHLAAGGGDLERRPHRHLGLAEADVAAHQPVHRLGRLEILLDGVDRDGLVVGLVVGERGLEPRHPLVVGPEPGAGGVLAARVERQQLAGQLPHGDPCPALERGPRLAAQRERAGALPSAPT